LPIKAGRPEINVLQQIVQQWSWRVIDSALAVISHMTAPANGSRQSH